MKRPTATNIDDCTLDDIREYLMSELPEFPLNFSIITFDDLDWVSESMAFCEGMRSYSKAMTMYLDGKLRALPVTTSKKDLEYVSLMNKKKQFEHYSEIMDDRFQTL